jgi:signal peptidase I
MYGERYGRDDDRGSPSYPRYRSAGSIYGTPSGSDVSRSKPRRSAYQLDGLDGDQPRRPRYQFGEDEPRRSRYRSDDEQPRSLHRLDDDEPRKPEAAKRKQMPLWQEMPLLLIVAFCLAVLIRTFLLQAFFIPSGSMEDTLLVGDRVLVNKVVYDTRDPLRGEVVVFRGTAAWVPENPAASDVGFFSKLGRTVGDLVGVSRPGEKDFIKRVIGLPGDRVSCCDKQGRVLVNGKALDEPYVIENSPLDAPQSARECRSRRFEEVTVEPGQMFVMGDHRFVSQDSRCQGQVPIENVIGRAFVIVWPSKRWGSLPVPSTFDSVPVAQGAPGAGSEPGTGAGSGRERSVVAGSVAAPGGPPMTGALGIVMPILLVSVFPARSPRNFPGWRRRLAA